MATTESSSRFSRDYLETEMSRLKALASTLELRIATLEDAGLDASKEKSELAEAAEQLARVTAQRAALKP